MILQALKDYYDRKGDDSTVPPPGFDWREIPFIVEIDQSGKFLGISDVREGDGKKKRGKNYLLPQGPVGRTSGVKPYLLADNPEYLFLDTKKRDAFVALIRAIPEFQGEADLVALISFFETVNVDTVTRHPLWPEIKALNAMMAFRLTGEPQPVGQSLAVRRYVETHPNLESDGNGICSITGKVQGIARLHPLISGVKDAKTTGAALVSFQRNSGYDSYKKEQANNAPVGKRAAFACTTALNHLLAKGSRQRVQVGDASTVFWAEKSSGAEFETAFLDFLDPPRDNPDLGAQAVASLYRSVRDGRPFTANDGQRFHVLGLAPNAARIAVRFWHVATIAELGHAFHRYFNEVDIVRPGYESGAPLSLFRLLASTALQGKAENIPPNLGGDVMQAILGGGRYPATLMQGALRRIRAEREVSYPRAALLKAYLIRNNPNDKEITVSLNEENTNLGYRLGRLFAVLERVQQDAAGGPDKINSTIRDSYFGSASSIPGSVFPTLVRRNQHHMSKLRKEKPKLHTVRDKQIQAILNDGVDGETAFPPILALSDQGRFAIGYYHQRQAFFNKPESDTLDQPATDKE